MKNWKQVLGIVLAFSTSGVALAGDPIAIAINYGNQYKELALQRNNKEQDFEAMCRMFRANFDVKFATAQVRSYGFQRAGINDASEGLLLGYLVAFALNKQDYLAESRNDRPENLGARNAVVTGRGRVGSTSYSVVRFQVRAGGDNVDMKVTDGGLVLDVGNHLGYLVEAAAKEFGNGSGSANERLTSYISSYVTPRMTNGCQ